MKKPLGIQLLSYFYLSLILLYILPLFVFSTRIVVLGRIANEAGTALVNSSSLIFLFFLYLSVKNQRKTGLFLAILFHGLFLVNNLLMLFQQPPILEIEGLKPGDYTLETFTIIATALLNTLIIMHLYLKRQRYFFSVSDAMTS